MHKLLKRTYFVNTLRALWGIYIITALVTGLLLLVIGLTRPKAYLVKETEDSFVPSELTINLGDTVLFDGAKSTPYWPASNDHPDHLLYLDFDPHQPLGPGQKWKFTFNKLGDWEYHDHLEPEITGVIKVNGARWKEILLPLAKTLFSVQERRVDLSGCKEISNEVKKQFCLDEYFSNLVYDKGASKALKKLSEELERDPFVAKWCHYLSEVIGEEAYVEYHDGVDFEITSDITMCDSGFFHSFMQDYVSHELGYADAYEFCRRVERDLNGNQDALTDCMFGLGLGITHYYAILNWMDADTILDLGISTCEAFDDLAKVCRIGVLSGFSHLYVGSSDGIKMPLARGNPFKLCENEALGEERDECYLTMVGTYNVAFRNPKATADFINLVEDREMAANMMVELGASIWMVEYRNPEAVLVCREYESFLKESCFQGFFERVKRYVAPSEAKEFLTKTCDKLDLSGAEIDQCRKVAEI